MAASITSVDGVPASALSPGQSVDLTVAGNVVIDAVLRVDLEVLGSMSALVNVPVPVTVTATETNATSTCVVVEGVGTLVQVSPLVWRYTA